MENLGQELFKNFIEDCIIFLPLIMIILTILKSIFFSNIKYLYTSNTKYIDFYLFILLYNNIDKQELINILKNINLYYNLYILEFKNMDEINDKNINVIEKEFNKNVSNMKINRRIINYIFILLNVACSLHIVYKSINATQRYEYIFKSILIVLIILIILTILIVSFIFLKPIKIDSTYNAIFRKNNNKNLYDNFETIENIIETYKLIVDKIDYRLNYKSFDNTMTLNMTVIVFILSFCSTFGTLISISQFENLQVNLFNMNINVTEIINNNFFYSIYMFIFIITFIYIITYYLDFSLRVFIDKSKKHSENLIFIKNNIIYIIKNLENYQNLLKKLEERNLNINETEILKLKLDKLKNNYNF